MMNPSRQSKREDLEANINYRSQLTQMPPEALLDERLAQLQAFIRQLGSTPTGQADLRNRVRRYGDCRRSPSESVSRYYGRLRRWLDGNTDDQAEKSKR